ncbi:hypothetical protein RF11_08138 [Thelohanellus kitauei]|uniref:Uncharacterized protein n=1 Tax=Thelohanellus kitauei TaxID=669202 RepID=A0A0C2MAQ6_THEKT|nr:hypothetical protein RF11_08138 [Thelohanellus kitauei]
MCIEHKPWLDMLPPKLTLKAEVDAVLISDDINQEKQSIANKELFSEISLEKRCRASECVANYTLTLVNVPILYPNTHEPIIFDFDLINFGDFMAHFILKADISMQCYLDIIDHETHRYYSGFVTIDHYNDSNHTHLNTVYPMTTGHEDFITFYVKAMCSQAFDCKIEPIFNLTSRSLLPYAEKRFTFKIKEEPEFWITTPQLIYIHHSRVPLKEILANACLNITMLDTNKNTKHISVQEFRIKLTCYADNIQLYYTSTIHLTGCQEIPFFLTVKRLIDNRTEYTAEELMNQQAQHYVMILLKTCTLDVFILIVAMLMIRFPGSVITLVICYKREKRTIRLRGTVTYENRPDDQENE